MHKWNTAIEGIEELAVAEWSDKLAGLTGEQIKTGLDSLTDDWPPSAPEFRKYCLGEGKNDLGLNYKPPYHREFRANRLIESDEVKTKRKAAAKLAFSNINKIIQLRR